MSNRDKQRQQSRQQEAAPTRLEWAPPPGKEDVPPQLSNTVVISGGTDALVLTFYYHSPNTLSRAAGSVPKWPHIERAGDLVTVRGEPIARVALPFTVAVDTVVDMVESLVNGAPDVQRSVMGVMERFAAIMQRAESMNINIPDAAPTAEGAK
ncbi:MULTISPECIES: hypothetical protein [Sorangium]|uniref:hypothetical protein n=1 Tax=Sorangium TaxID=39643 RepID=UPI003D9C306F